MKCRRNKRSYNIITQRKTEQLTNSSSKIEANLDPETKRASIQAKEKGASSWLPIEENGFTLTKNEFRDAIHLRYNKTFGSNSCTEPHKRRFRNSET